MPGPLNADSFFHVPLPRRGVMAFPSFLFHRVLFLLETLFLFGSLYVTRCLFFFFFQVFCLDLPTALPPILFFSQCLPCFCAPPFFAGFCIATFCLVIQGRVVRYSPPTILLPPPLRGFFFLGTVDRIFAPDLHSCKFFSSVVFPPAVSGNSWLRSRSGQNSLSVHY